MRGRWSKEDTHLNLIALVVALILFSNLPVVPRFGVMNVQSIQDSSAVSYHFVQYKLPQGSGGPWSITTDKNGRIWFAEVTSNQIGMFDPTTMKFSEYAIPSNGSLPEIIAADQSDNIWFTELEAESLGLLANGSSQIVEYHIPKGPQNLACGPIGVTPSLGGNIWITCEFSNQIDEFIRSNSTFLQFNLPVYLSAPLQIVFDPEGNFWFTGADADMLGFVNSSLLVPGTTKGITEFAPLNSTYSRTVNSSQASGGVYQTSLSTPSQLALSSDGKMIWITEHTASSFNSYNIATKSLNKYFTSQTHNKNYVESLPNGIAIDGNGIVWIAEHYGNKIAEFDPGDEQLTEYPIPCCSDSIAGSLYLALGRNGTIWFSEFYGGAIGELVPDTSGSSLTVSFGSTVNTFDQNSNLTIPINIDLAGEGMLNATANLDISGVSLTGKLVNMTAAFSPSTVLLNSSGHGSSVLTLHNEGLNQGVYYLTVSATLSSNGFIYSSIVKLKVPAQFTGLLETGAIIGVGVSVVVILGIIFYSRQRGSRRNIRNRRKS